LKQYLEMAKRYGMLVLLLAALTSCEGGSTKRMENVLEKVGNAVRQIKDALEEDESTTVPSSNRNDTLNNLNNLNTTTMKYSPIIERNLTAEERKEIAHARLPQGNWSGERGESLFLPYDLDEIPTRGQYSNMKHKTWRQILKENNCSDGVPFKNGEVCYDAIGKVYATVTFDGNEGIGEYLRPKGSGYDREQLHTEAYNRLAKQWGVTADEVKVYKGDAGPVEYLMDQWQCTEQEVWDRCRNPQREIRVFHECQDGRTVIIVPRELHDHLSHTGGVEMYDQARSASLSVEG